MSAFVLAVVGTGGAAAVFKVLSEYLRLRFFRHVYDKGGAEDVAKVASAVVGKTIPADGAPESLPNDQPAQGMDTRHLSRRQRARPTRTRRPVAVTNDTTLKQ